MGPRRHDSDRGSLRARGSAPSVAVQRRADEEEVTRFGPPRKYDRPPPMDRCSGGVGPPRTRPAFRRGSNIGTPPPRPALRSIDGGLLYWFPTRTDMDLPPGGFQGHRQTNEGNRLASLAHRWSSFVCRQPSQGRRPSSEGHRRTNGDHSLTNAGHRQTNEGRQRTKEENRSTSFAHR
jgi:hypothetical protein